MGWRDPNMRPDAKISLVWSLAGALATVAVLPYAFDLLPGVRAKHGLGS